MKKNVMRYGLYAGIGELITFVLVWLIIDLTGISHKAQGYLGYAAILCPMVFVYFGLRYYRDRINNGQISFLAALKLGILIILIPVVAYAIIETVYVIYIDPHFYEKVAGYDLEQYRKVLSPAKYAARLKQTQQQFESLKNPLSNFIAMILYTGSLGVIVVVISALLVFRRANKAYHTQNT